MHIVLLKCPDVQIAFLKFTSYDNEALVGCIPIAAVAVHLNLKSLKISQSFHKMYSNNILNFQESTPILNVRTKKSGNLLKALYIYINMCVCVCVRRGLLWNQREKTKYFIIKKVRKFLGVLFGGGSFQRYTCFRFNNLL